MQFVVGFFISAFIVIGGVIYSHDYRQSKKRIRELKNSLEMISMCATCKDCKRRAEVALGWID